MARDRQRARQRRKRRPGPEEPAARPAAPGDATSDDARVEDEGTASAGGLDAARDSGVENVFEDEGSPGETPTPDPLKHASAWVDEAKLAEAGAEVDAPQQSRDAQDPSSRYSSGNEGGAPDGEPAAVAVGRPRRGRALTFLGQSAEELGRVQWPDRRQTGQGTAVVLGFVVLAGGFLGLMDAIWRPIVEAII